MSRTSKHPVRRLATLEKRLAFLKERLRNANGKNLSFDAQEADALHWAICICRQFGEEKK